MVTGGAGQLEVVSPLSPLPPLWSHSPRGMKKRRYEKGVAYTPPLPSQWGGQEGGRGQPLRWREFRTHPFPRSAHAGSHSPRCQAPAYTWPYRLVGDLSVGSPIFVSWEERGAPSLTTAFSVPSYVNHSLRTQPLFSLLPPTDTPHLTTTTLTKSLPRSSFHHTHTR